MALLISPFYNRAERRVRSFWRLLIQGLLFLIGLGILGLGMAFVAVTWLSINGTLKPEMFRDPTLIATLTYNAMTGQTGVGLIMGLLTMLLLTGTIGLVGHYVDRRRFVDYGLHINRTWWRDLGFGLALGAGLMLVIFTVEVVAGWVTITGTWTARGNFALGMAEGLIGFIWVGIYEELFSRGYQLRNLAEGLNWQRIGPRRALILAYVLSSLVFGILHQANANATVFTWFNLMLAGLFLGLGYVLTGELGMPIGIHISWNFFQGNVFGFPVSGGAHSASVVAIRQLGPSFWTGGAFGPEGGLLGLLALAAGCAAIVWWVRRTRGEVKLEEKLAIYGPPPPSGGRAHWIPVIRLRVARKKLKGG